VNDRDGLTDMTLLHYTCKSGAHGIGECVVILSLALIICICAHTISCVPLRELGGHPADSNNTAR
jgi:hypothetical protein